MLLLNLILDYWGHLQNIRSVLGKVKHESLLSLVDISLAPAAPHTDATKHVAIHTRRRCHMATGMLALPAYEVARRTGCCNASGDAASAPLRNKTLQAFLYPPRKDGWSVASLAVATVHTVGSARSAGCGIVKWCFSAQAFATSAIFPPGAAQPVVVTNNESWARDECRTPGVHFVQTQPYLEKLVRAWGDKQPWPGASRKRSRPPRPVTLIKWALFALTEYRAIFYSDVDVDLFLHSAGRPPAEDSAAFASLARAWTMGY